MPFGVDDALAIGAGLLPALGVGKPDTPNASDIKNMQNQQILQQLMQWQRAQGLAEAGVAGNAQRDIEKLPLRDQLQYMLQARMGLPQQQMSYQRGALPMSGSNAPDINQQFNQAQANYKPGLGGVDMTGKVQHQLMNSLGYGDNGNLSLLDQHRQMAPGEKLQDYVNRWMVGQTSGQAQAGLGNYGAPPINTSDPAYKTPPPGVTPPPPQTQPLAARWNPVTNRPPMSGAPGGIKW